MQIIRPVFGMSIIVILDQKIEQMKHNSSFIYSFSECLLNSSNYSIMVEFIRGHNTLNVQF